MVADDGLDPVTAAAVAAALAAAGGDVEEEKDAPLMDAFGTFAMLAKDKQLDAERVQAYGLFTASKVPGFDPATKDMDPAACSRYATGKLSDFVASCDVLNVSFVGALAVVALLDAGRLPDAMATVDRMSDRAAERDTNAIVADALVQLAAGTAKPGAECPDWAAWCTAADGCTPVLRKRFEAARKRAD